MSGAAALLWVIAGVYGVALALFLAHWFTSGIRYIERDQRRDLPRVRTRIKL